MAKMLEAGDLRLAPLPLPLPRSGPVLTLREYGALAAAPRKTPEPDRKGPGTTVSVWAKPVHQVMDKADHMWVELDDGRRQLIARGGPNETDAAGMVGAAMFGDLRVKGQVDPARQSPDFGQQTRLMAREYLPGVSAEEAAAGARRHAAGVNNGASAYGRTYNSNSFAADVTEDLLGRRVGDDRTPGYRSRLSEAPRQIPRPPIDFQASQLPRMLLGVP